MNSIQNQFTSIEQVTGRYLKNNHQSTASADSNFSFEEILQEQQKTNESRELKFSKHALNRLSDRNINLSQGQKTRLEEGTLKAEEKGIKESLVLVDDLVFIVNIKNQTVVTAMDQTEANENVFTNIDGAVII
ncbi:TIGR02530 family flagellar biosynthesis protein [Anaerosacchariphilus polymeriproducens]|uniref:Flagellar protein n=1 Tax=Anaerosacchariphilus polymeriproducens TaxID=1812858 RepID=A0A371AS88_9FIRM|nr:TIGR02530 family flagellar biosynthesis protein [Anaerosacchariphilus polymeriproducens]RDU22429.1 flagellar protein [Anaerosacchariphilus polymeriproducens]